MFPYITVLVMDSKGRIVIPAKVRENLGLLPGDVLKLEQVGNEIKIVVNGEKLNENQN